MVEINLIENYYLKSDARQWILSEKKVIESGKGKGSIKWNDVGYYTSIKTLVRDLLERVVRQENATSLGELIQYTTEKRDALKLLCTRFELFELELEKIKEE